MYNFSSPTSSPPFQADSKQGEDHSDGSLTKPDPSGKSKNIYFLHLKLVSRKIFQWSLLYVLERGEILQSPLLKRIIKLIPSQFRFILFSHPFAFAILGEKSSASAEKWIHLSLQGLLLYSSRSRNTGEMPSPSCPCPIPYTHILELRNICCLPFTFLLLPLNPAARERRNGDSSQSLCSGTTWKQGLQPDSASRAHVQHIQNVIWLYCLPPLDPPLPL